MGFFQKQLLFILILSCGSVFVGQSLAYFSPVGIPIQDEFHWSKTKATLFSALSSIIAIPGCPLTNFVVPFLGRKKSVFFYSILSLITWILIYVTKSNFSWLAFLARSIQGLCVGGLSSVCSMYIVEISPIEEKGAYGTLHQFGITVGMLYCYFLGIFCSWRLTTILCGLPVLFLAGLIWIVPESPVVEQEKSQGERLKESLWQKKFVPSMVAVVLLIFFQQFSGINALDTNLEEIFINAKVSLKPTISATLVGLSQTISTGLVPTVVEKFGRRLIFIISAFGQFVALLLSWINEVWHVSPILPVISIFLDFFFFGVGFGPVPWFIAPELFPDSVRQLAVSLASMMNWTMVTIVIFIWPEMAKGMGMGWGFFLFAIICAIGGVYGIFWMPETMQKSDNVGDQPLLENEVV